MAPGRSLNAGNWHRTHGRSSQRPLLVGLVVALGLFGLLTGIALLDSSPDQPRLRLRRADDTGPLDSRWRARVACVDRLSDCPGLVARGECTSHPEFLHAACPVACGLCVPANGSAGAATAQLVVDRAAPAICQDHSPDCEERARAGECDANKPMELGGIHGHLRVWCPRSCGLCTDAPHHHHRGEQPVVAIGSGCADHAPDCAARAAAGGCTSEVTAILSRMVVECAAACGTCQRRQEAHAAPISAIMVERVAAAEPAAAGDGGGGDGDGARPPCRDERRACEYWRGIGECERAAEVMRRMCAVSCGACVQSDEERTPPAERPTPCDGTSDRHEDCFEWAKGGECERSPAQMQQVCGCACRQPHATASAERGGSPPGAVAAVAAAAAAVAACSDQHERCSGWLLAGLCETAPVPMRRLCPRSCGSCGAGPRAALAAAAGDLEEEAAVAAAGAAGDGGEAGAAGGPTLHGLMAHYCSSVSVSEGAAAATGAASTLPVARVALPVANRDVRLTPGSDFFAAQQLNAEYLLGLSVPRLLWSFYETAGLPPPAGAEPYGGWEDAAKGGWPDPHTPTRTLRGHFVGHFLSALALLYAASGDVRVLQRGREVLGGLRACQQAGSNSGFVSAWPESVLDTLERGAFGEVWAPWYTLHKIVAGLLDWHEHAEGGEHGGGDDDGDGDGGGGAALVVAQRLGSYLAARVGRVVAAKGEQWWQTTLEVEFGGIGEAAYRLHLLSLAPGAARNATAAAAALALARAFHRRSFLEPLRQPGRDGLRNRHANTHLPVLVAAARGAEVDADAALLSSAVNAYCLLQLGYAYAGSGGSSVNEHWQHAAAATGAASRTVFASGEREDLVGGCMALADAGACERSAPFMEAHCAASCDDRRRGGAAPAPSAPQPEPAQQQQQQSPPPPPAGGHEHVHPTDSDAFHTQESCTQYNALKLNAELFGRAPHAGLADAFERKLLNGVMGIQRPHVPGAYLYMMPLGRGVSKDKANWAGFGEAENAFWCCYGTGIESFAKLNDAVYFEASPPPPPLPPPSPSPSPSPSPPAAAPPTLWVSQFVPSVLHWRRGGATVQLSTELERDGCRAMRLTLTLTTHAANASTAPPAAGCFGPDGCALQLRLPSWADPNASHVTLRDADGVTSPLEPSTAGQPLRVGRFLRLQRRWAPGTVVSARFGLYAYVERANDWRAAHSATHALLYGPHMLVALVGPQAPPSGGAGPSHVLRADAAAVREWVSVARCAVRESGDASASWEQLRLEARGADGRVVALAPLSAVVDEPYTSYLDLI